jgi:hypothetical protein
LGRADLGGLRAARRDDPKRRGHSRLGARTLLLARRAARRGGRVPPVDGGRDPSRRGRDRRRVRCRRGARRDRRGRRPRRAARRAAEGASGSHRRFGRPALPRGGSARVLRRRKASPVAPGTSRSTSSFRRRRRPTSTS